MTSEVDKILARVAQAAENNPIARNIFEQRQAVGQQLPEGMQPHSEYRFNPTTDALESTESDGRFMAYADGMDSLKDAGLGGLKGGIGLLDLGLTTVDTLATQLKNGTRFIGDVGTGTPMKPSEYNVNDNSLRKLLLDSGVYDKKNVQEYYADKGSDTYKLAEARIQAMADNEESDLGKFYVGTLETLKDPTSGVPMVMESLPATFGGGIVGRGIAKVAPILGDILAGVIIPRAGALGEGAMASGMAFSDLSAQKAEQGEGVTLHDARYVPAVGAGTYAFGRLFNNSLDIESALANGVTKTGIVGLAPTALMEAGQEAGQGYSESVFNQMTLNNGEVDFGQAAYDAGRSSASGVYMSGMMSGPSALANTPSAISQGAGKVKQQFQATHDDLINPAYKKFNPAQAYANAQTAFNKATTPEQQQQATEQMRQAEEAIYTGVSKFDESINNETDETKKKKLEESKNKWLNSQVTTLNTITDAVQSEQDEGFSASSILDNYSKLGAIQAQQEQAQAQTNTNTDVDLSQVNRPTGDMVTPNTQATQTTKPNGYVKGKPVAIMGSYALKSDGKHRDTGAGTGDHYDIRLASDSKTGVKNGHRDNSVGYLNRFITSDGESLANARATSGYGMRNGRMHWGLDFGANGSFKQNQAKRTLLIAPEWEDRVVSLDTRKDNVKYDKNGNRTDGGYYTRVTFDDGAVLHILHQDAKGQAQLKQAHGNATTNQQTNPVQATSTTVNSSWQGKKHRDIGNNTTYDSKMSSIYSQYGFTLAEQQILKAQVGQESGFDAKAKNAGSGAFGLTQFIKGTAERFGVKPNDVDSMLHGQAKYMRYLLDRYKGDWAKALAGYNTGEGNVDAHWGKDGTGNGGGVMSTKWNRGNGETLLYVENILANAGTMTINGQGGNTDTVNSNTIQGSIDTTEQTNRLIDLLAQMDNETNTENLQKLQEQVNQLQEQIANTVDTANTQPEATQEQKQYAEQVEPQIIRRYSRMALDGDIDQAKAEIQQFQQAGVLSEEKANSLISLLDIKASIKSNTMSGVSEDIYNGSKHGDTALENNLGLKDYERVFNSGNQKTINQYVDYLENFRDNHNAKSSILQQALAEFNTTGKDQYVGRTTDGWQFITQEQYENKSANETAYQINGRSQKLINAVTNEAKAIDSFTNNWQTILNQKGNKSVQQNNNQQQQQVQQQQSQPKPVEPSTGVPTVPTVPTTPKPISNTNTNSAYAKTAQEMNDPNGVWVGRNGYGKDTVSMSQVDGSTQPYIGMFGSPFNESGSHGWVLNDDGSHKTKEEVRQLHIQKYKEKLAEYYSHGKKKWFRDAVESLRDKTVYTGMRNSSSAVEVQVISQFLEETKDMSDEEKLAYARALSQGGRDTANAIKSGKLDNTVSNRLGNTNTNSNQQQEPVFDENDNPPSDVMSDEELALLDLQRQANEQEEVFDEDEDVELALDDENISTSKPKTIKLDEPTQEEEIGISKGKHELLDIIEHIDFNDIQLVIANAIVNKYPDTTVSFDGTTADIILPNDKPQTVLERLVLHGTRDVLVNPDKSEAHQKVHKSLDYVISKLSQYKTTNQEEQQIIQELLQSKEALVALGTSVDKYVDFLKSIETKERKIKSNLFSTLVRGFMSFLGIPAKATTINLYESLLATTGNAVQLQAKDIKSHSLSMVSDSNTRSKEQDKPFYEQNLITSSFTQSTKGNLANVKSLSPRLIQKGIKEIKRLGLKEPTQVQQEQLEHYLEFEQEFKQALYNSFQSKKDDYRWQDLKQFLNIGTNENPLFDDNVITALALSAYDYIAHNGGSSFTSADDISTLLDLGEDTLVPNYILYKYREAGVSINEAMIDLGKSAVKSLGLTAIDTAPHETKARLESSLGDWILTTMLENHSAVKNTYSQQELENDKAQVTGKPAETKADMTTKTTITLRPLNRELTTVTDIVDKSKGTSGYLSNLYGSSTRKRNVSLEPIEHTIDNIDGTLGEVSKEQMKTIKRVQKEPMKLNQSMSSIMDWFVDNNLDVLHEMFGAKVYTEEELETQGVHISERETKIKSAESNLRALDSYLDFKAGLPSVDTLFYDQIKVVKNSRMHYNSNVFNFQSEKVHRALGEYANFEITLNTENFTNGVWFNDDGKPTAETYFLRAIFENAEGTEGKFKEALKRKKLSDGYTVDKLSSENFIPTALGIINSKDVKTASRGIHSIQAGKKPTEPQLRAIQKVVKAWGMGANSFRALVEVANLHKATAENKPFTTSLGLGSDGINNGTGIGMVQMGIKETLTLQRLGLFGEGADNQTYFDTRTDTSIGDYYTAFKDYLLTEVDNLADETAQVNVLHALKALNTSLEKRKILKAILIPFGYGAGNPRLIRASAEQMIKDTYASLTEIHLTNDTVGYDTITTQLQTIIGDDFKLPSIDKLLNYEFKPNDYALLIEAYETLLGRAISRAVKSYAEEFIDRRNFNIDIHNSVSRTLIQAREWLLEQAKAKHEQSIRDKYKDATERELERLLAYHTLSTKDIREQVDKSLDKMFATVRTRHQVEDENEKGSIEFVKSEKTFRQDISIKAITQVFNHKTKGLRDKTNSNVFIRDKNLVDTGVTPNSQMTQQQDAYVSSQAMIADDVVSINVHDANIGRLNHVARMAYEQNKAFFHGTAKYHLYSESLEALMTTIENIYEVMGEGYVTSEVAIELVESLIGNYIPEANTTGELIQKVVTDAIDKGVPYDLNKLQLLGELSTVHQYAGEAGEYTVTQEDKDMLQEQAKVLKEKEANLLKRLDKAVSKFNHPLDYHTQVQPIPTNINQVVNHTGGANGSDTSWDKVGREYGFNNHRHLASKGQYMDRSLSRVDLTEQEILFGLNQVNTLLKRDYSNNYVGRLHARNYYQVINADAVYAVAPITGKSRVSGGTNTAVQVGIKLNKPVYVWDTDTEQWYKYQPILKRFVVYDKPVVLTPNYAGVGTRDIDNKPKGKGQKSNPDYLGDDVRAKALHAMAEVYQNTITAINDRATQVTNTDSTLDSEVSSGVLNYEQTEQLINTLSKQDKDKLRDTVAKHLNKDNPSLKQVVEYVMEFGLPSQNLSLDTLTEQAIGNLTDDEVSAIYEQNKEAIQELLQQDLLYQLDVSSDFFNRVLSKDTLKELAKLRSDNPIRLSVIRNSALPTTVKQYLTAQLSSMGYKRLTGNQLFKAFNNSYIQHQRIKQLDHELERRLVSMVKSLGYTVSVKTKQELKDKYGLGINGVFSVVQKSIEVVHANERNITTLPEEALHAIIEVANWKSNGSMLNALYKQLSTWSEYPKVYNRYASIYTRNGTPNKSKIHKEIMAQVLSYAITGHKDFKFYSIESIDDGFVTGILKKFIDLIGRIYDDFTGKGVDRELRKTASIIADYLKEGNLDGIVHSRTTKGNLLNVENTLTHQRTIDNGFGEKLIQDISSLGGVITGSFGLRYYNSIFREAKDSLHDIDLYLDIKKELKATRYKSLRRDEFEDTNFFKELSKQYPHLSFAVSFGEVYDNQVYQYVVTKDTQTKALIDQAIEQLNSQRKRVGIDTITELLPEDKANQFYWLDIFIGYDIPNTFDSKLGMNFLSYERGITEKNSLGRSKDANDYMNSHAMDTGNYIDSYFQVDETEIEYKRRILKEAVRKLHNLSFDNNKSAGEVTVTQTLNQYLISKVLEVNPTLKIESKSYPEGNFGGEYVPSTNTIYINDKLTGDKYYTALNHELYHALTETGLTKDTQAGRELKKIYEHLKSLNSNWVHELENINEFVAYAMTDKAFMDWVLANTNLQQLGIKPRTTNKLKAFINIVLSVFGFNQSNQTLDTLVSLIDETMITYDPNSIGDTPVRNVMYSDATSQVNGMNVSDVFKDLPTNVSQAHNEHLDKVIDNIIGTYGNTHQRKLANIANGKLRNTSLLNGFKSSDKEAYITDALIIVFESYLKAHTGNMAVNGLNNLYRDAIKQYASVKDLFPNFATASKEDKAQMVKMYNFIFNNKTKQDNVARFMAMTLANEQFRQLMQSGRKPMRDNTTWFDKAMRVLDKVVNWFNRVYFWSKSNKHSDFIDAMTKRLVDLDIKARNTSVDWLQVGWTNTLEFTGKALDKPVKKLGYLLMDKVIKQFAGSKGKLGTLGSLAKLQSDVKTLKDLEKEDAEIPLHESVVNRLLSKTYGDGRYKIIRDTINEVTMYGKRGKWIENMIRLTQSIGKVRQAMKESTIRVFDEVFETPLTKEQKSDITKVVLRTELSSLVRHGFSIEKVASMFEQVTLNKTIDNYAKQLIKKVGYTKANDMLMQSKALGYYMAKESTVRNMTKSAQGIAIGLGTDYQTDFSNMDSDVFMLVDVLSTLYTLDYTDKSARQSVKALLENEPLAMNTVLQLQKGLVDKGRDEFEHNPLNYQKGYTPQITNPYRKLIWVTTPDEIKMLKAQGFEEVTKLTKDKLDDTDQRTLILHTAYSPNNYVSGGLDLADSHARGTTVYKQGINDREIAKVTKANIAMRKQRNQGSYMNYDPSVDRNAMVATYATDGAILDYHYEMEGNTRDIYLERDNSFDELMGTLHGNLEFKPQIREHQANIAKEIFREAKANFAKNPNEFVLLDFDNPDPVVQETMKLLPYSFRKEIIKHFGDGVVPVHKSVYTSMFGFRAYSIANTFDKLYDPEQKLNRAEKLITGIFRAFSKEKARHRAVQLEKLIQDFMFVIKDYIVIRSGGVLMGNIISNILLLSLHGVNPIKILQDSIFAWRNSNRYTKTQAKVNDLNTRLLGLTNKQEIGLIKRELKTLQRELENNPMHEFMQLGLIGTIVEDLTNQDNKYKTPIQESTDKYLNKIPKLIRSTFSNLTIDKGTLLHSFLSDATQFSDLSAKYVLTKHNMDKGMDISNAIYESQINFINYGMPTNQLLDYMNRMGFMMFTKFFLRFQQVMLKLFNKMPVTSLAQHYAIEQLGGQGIYEPFIFNRFGNPFDDSIFMADNVFADAIITDSVF